MKLSKAQMKAVMRAVNNLPPSKARAVRTVKGRIYFALPKRVWAVGKARPNCARAMLGVGAKARPPRRVVRVHYAPNSYAVYSCSQVRIFSPGPPAGVFPGAALSGMKVLGSGWLSVAVIPAGVGLPGLSPSSAKRPIASSSSTSGQLFIPAGQGPPGGQVSALLHILLNSAAPVHGTWGSGRLLRTSLFSALITSKGKVLIGAVTPAVLYADAAKVK
jgi:hypothetical protein